MEVLLVLIPNLLDDKHFQHQIRGLNKELRSKTDLIRLFNLPRHVFPRLNSSILTTLVKDDIVIKRKTPIYPGLDTSVIDCINVQKDTKCPFPIIQSIIDWFHHPKTKPLLEIVRNLACTPFMIGGSYLTSIAFNQPREVDMYVWGSFKHFPKVQTIPSLIFIDPDITFAHTLSRLNLSYYQVGLIIDGSNVSILYSRGLIYSWLTSTMIIDYGRCCTSIKDCLLEWCETNPDWSKEEPHPVMTDELCELQCGLYHKIETCLKTYNPKSILGCI